jgi:MarR family
MMTEEETEASDELVAKFGGDMLRLIKAANDGGACADCLILARGSSGTTLYVRGRDIEEGEKAVMFGTENCRWSLLGEAAEIHRTDNQTKILAALKAATGLMNPADIAAVAEMSTPTVNTTLHRLAEKGAVVQVRRGRWAYPGKPFATPQAGKS